MIAALAAGMLGQLEGLGTVSSGIAGVAGLLGAREGTGQAGAAGGRAQGSGVAHHPLRAALPLSDQLQGVLLQQQEQPGLPQAMQADQVAGPVTLG